MLRVNKHDYLNQLQVVLGYLQLQKPERALTYVREAIAEIEASGSILRLNLPEISTWLLLKKLMQEEQGITMNLSCNSDFSAVAAWGKAILAYLESLVPFIATILDTFPDELREWNIYFGGSNPLEIRFMLPLSGEHEWEHVFNEKIAFLKEIEPSTSNTKEQDKFIYQLQIPARL